MDVVIITLKSRNEETSYDLELPNNVQVKELKNTFIDLMHLDDNKSINFAVRADPLGRVLDDEETLAEAGVWDGSILTLV